jgi:hypothetical protein
MSRVAPKHLVGAYEIAERLGLSHTQSVHTIRKRKSEFPQSIAILKSALIWYWREIEV